MKTKEQTRKLVAGCSKHCFEVVDRTDEISSKHCFEVVNEATWFEEIFEKYHVNNITMFLICKSYSKYTSKKPLRFFSKVLILLITILNSCSKKGSVEFFWAVWTT